MDHFAGLDVSVKETRICIVDETGRIVREVKVANEPQALLKVLGHHAYCFKRIGQEAGSLTQWLFSALAGPHGATNFLTKTLPRVAAEVALSVLVYDLIRVMNIGTKPLMAAIAV